MPIYRIMNIDDYEAAYALWIKCGNGLNDKDDSREGIDKYLKRNPGTSFVAIIDEKVVGVILCGHDGRICSLKTLQIMRRGNTESFSLILIIR